MKKGLKNVIVLLGMVMATSVMALDVKVEVEKIHTEVKALKQSKMKALIAEIQKLEPAEREAKMKELKEMRADHKKNRRAEGKKDGAHKACPEDAMRMKPHSVK